MGKREEYRDAIFARSPSSITYEVSIPEERCDAFCEPALLPIGP